MSCSLFMCFFACYSYFCMYAHTVENQAIVARMQILANNSEMEKNILPENPTSQSCSFVLTHGTAGLRHDTCRYTTILLHCYTTILTYYQTTILPWWLWRLQTVVSLAPAFRATHPTQPSEQLIRHSLQSNSSGTSLSSSLQSNSSGTAFGATHQAHLSLAT